MSQVFNSYSTDITKSIQSIKSSLNSCSSDPLSKKQSTIPSLKVQMYEIQKCIKLMQTEIISFSGKQKNISSQKIKTYKSQYQTLRKKVLLLEEDIRNQRNNKSKDNNSTPNTTSNSLQLNDKSNSRKSRKDHKYSKLQEQHNDSQDVNLKLKQSKKIMYQISDMSDGISYELKNQTDSIQNSKSKLGKIRGQLIKGEKKIKRMMIRLRRNQFVCYLVILMLVLMAAFIISKIFT